VGAHGIPVYSGWGAGSVVSMSDTYYRERAAQRNRRYIIAAVVVLTIGCVAFSIFNVFRDDCTGSIERAPDSIVDTYLQALPAGDVDAAVRCWEHNVFYETDVGCSELCLTRFFGNGFQVTEVELSSPVMNDDGRTVINAQVTIICSESETPVAGTLELETVGAELPWRHWKIVHSEIGGTFAEPWCQ